MSEDNVQGPTDAATANFADQFKWLLAALGAILILAVVASVMSKEKGTVKDGKAEAQLREGVTSFEARVEKIHKKLDKHEATKNVESLQQNQERMKSYLDMAEETQRVLADMLSFFEDYNQRYPDNDEETLRALWSPLVEKLEGLQGRLNKVHSGVQEEAKKEEEKILKGLNGKK